MTGRTRRAPHGLNLSEEGLEVILRVARWRRARYGGRDLVMTAHAIPIINTPRLCLTLPGPEAAADMVNYFRRNRAHLAPWEPPFNRAMFTQAFWRRRLRDNRRECQKNQSLRLVAFHRQQPAGPAIGMINFSGFAQGVSMSCHLGYSIDVAQQGRGLMREALTVAIGHVFEHMRRHRISANYMPSNHRSARLLARLGFVVEGYARDYLYIDGGWRDHVLTSITNTVPLIPDYIRATQAERSPPD